MGIFYFRFFCCRSFVAALLLVLSASALLSADIPAENSDVPALAAPKAPAETPSEAQQALRAALQVQEQLHQTLLTIEQSRKDSEAAAQQNADLIATRLNIIEQAINRQHTQESEMANNSTRFALIVAALLGGLGLLVMLLTGWFLVRTARQFSEMAALAAQPALGHMAPAGLLADGGPVSRQDMVAASGGRLLGAIERLEKRIYDIEHSALVAHPSAETATGDHRAGNGAPHDAKSAQAALLLGKGQSLLHLDQAENAIASFDEVLALDPQNTEALVKKGAALEKLKRLEDAVACYDRAIAVDESMTLAYLYKGGVFNQLERFGEALQCYEKALRTQQKVPVSSAA